MLLPILIALAAPPLRPAWMPPPPVHIFPARAVAVDRELARPYTDDVPFGSSGDRLWATSPQGWAFRDGVNLVYLTNLSAFDLRIVASGHAQMVRQAEYMPSHVHMVGGQGVEMDATASFTFTTDRVQNPLTEPFAPEKRWTCWSSGSRDDWYAVDLGRMRRLTGVDVWFFNDQPTGGCEQPAAVRVEAFREGGWQDVPTAQLQPAAGENHIRFENGPVMCDRIRLDFTNAGTDHYTGLYGFRPVPAPDEKLPPAAQSSVRVTGDKWITRDDVMVSRITAVNTGRRIEPLFLRMESALSGTMDGYADERPAAKGFPLYLRGAGWDGSRRAQAFLLDLAPGERRTFTFAMAADRTPAGAKARLAAVFAQPDPAAAQARAYQDWFTYNAATFACSDPLVTRMYYHRVYNLKKNSMNPRMGALRHRTFAEGRWTADWYANVISYGAAHQLRESRWLRDPSYAWGHLQTWTENEEPSGIYPSHVTPAGQQGGQYTDWITSAAWDVYENHPNRALLAKNADALGRNAEAWRKVWGWGGSPLLVVNSHWWTGMEWQPSFFSFAAYHTDAPGDETVLRRVDLTAYGYGDDVAAARVYRELGRTADADRFDVLAAEARSATLAHMWNPEDDWFHSLRASDFAMSPTREIIGLYPFYFDMPPPGRGYEAAWTVAMDPAHFRTPWPLASVDIACPAYSQTGWPVGPGGSGCMWNGPTWPHANSLVMQAMANTLRHYAKCSLTRGDLFSLFNSFTRAQYHDDNPDFPWTGEYYNGLNGEWKTVQRDYNHSTWLDPLIEDLIGIVPRDDDVLQVDPLLPRNAWRWYLLDGQYYRGHSITVACDPSGGHIAPGFRGYTVWVDGVAVHHASAPGPFTWRMAPVREQGAD